MKPIQPPLVTIWLKWNSWKYLGNHLNFVPGQISGWWSFSCWPLHWLFVCRPTWYIWYEVCCDIDTKAYTICHEICNAHCIFFFFTMKYISACQLDKPSFWYYTVYLSFNFNKPYYFYYFYFQLSSSEYRTHLHHQNCPRCSCTECKTVCFPCETIFLN
jgi:hypothetical protein